MPFTYIIESTSSKRWYFGSTIDPVERLNYHNRGWNRSTNGRGPWIIIFLKEFETLPEAREFEFILKRHKRKSYVLKRYSKYFLGKGARLAPA